MTGAVRVASIRAGDAPVAIAASDDVVVEPFGDGRWVVHGPDGTPDAWAWTASPRRRPDGITLVEAVVDGWRFELEIEDAARAGLRQRATRDEEAGPSSGPTEIRAIIPGRVAAVRVVAGDVVEVGQGLLVVEAMKMQNELRANRAGTVERVLVGAGQTIEPGDLLVVVR